MLEDKIRATDYEATSEAIEEQVAQQSYLDWLREKKIGTNSQVFCQAFSVLASSVSFYKVLNPQFVFAY